VTRAGFIINSRVPEVASFRKGMPPHALVTGWDDAGSPMSFMRFRWVAEALRTAGADWRYELYRPWRAYDAVVFLKSMGPHCLALAKRLRDQGTCVVFEANVDYYTRHDKATPLSAMSPAAEQRSQAIAITQFANAVLASSRHLAEVCVAFNPRVDWVPDNVNLALSPAATQVQPVSDGRLRVWWSGMADKLFEFLAAEEAFLALADRIHLHLVTDDIGKARERWPAEVRGRLERFFSRVPHTIHRFRDIRGLLQLYGAGGVIVSPRHLDVPYNLSHTEWKISLGMACGLPAIASPVPSYTDMAERAEGEAVSLCRSNEEWTQALEGFLASPVRLAEAGRSAREVVEKRYATDVVARRHAACLSAACAHPAK
jgi:glycosyltransferase involved in cell wall biosynthesis